ncbi:MAG: hypothetical protein QG656_48, partial [Candidatus Hydrogenedentes bacterium]|nr:hypothetical protein [Candidatus Hydrogenedentota bacterium]
AIAANEWSRLGLVKDPSGAAYAIAETWDGSAWRRAGTLYPLAQVAFKDAQGVIEEPKFRVASISASSDAMSVKLEATGADGTVWPAVLLIEPDVQAPRIHITTRLWAPCDAQLVSFYGPAVLAGDRAYGANKDFAIFPGVEYLEGAEESSSERDLVYPLSDRRVVLPYKIAAPVMAVQGQDTLIALLWDENQQWTPGMKHPAARFLAPKPDSGIEQVHMSLFAPSVGEFVKENTYGAYDTPFALKRGRDLKLDSWLVLDHAARHARDGVVHGPHKGGLVLQAMAQWFDVFGFPEPSPAPREWDAERALCRDAYANAVWSEDPPGWRHCAGWNAGLHVSQAVPQLVDIRAGMPEAERADAERRIDKVIAKALETEGKHYLWTNAGCHIMMGELPFYYGYVGESLANFRDFCLASLDGRKEGLWRWYPASEQHAKLGDAGGHTLGQASYPCMQSLRAARMTGDQGLLEKSLDAMRQMEQYEVPRGAQMWECPLYQPDILAAAQAIRAYCEAYRITGDEAHLAQARYWAWTGLPFLYTWELEGYPTMRYNVISVIGSTFFTHSWIGLPVVWCGEVYAYALQELAQYDDSLDWNRIAEGINHSAMWQQYTEGPSKGCYPDSWNMAKNKPNPSDINPENILVNEFRLKGPSPEIRSARFQCEDHVVMLNSAADIVDIKRDESGVIQFGLKGGAGFPVYTMLAPVPEPSVVEGVSGRAADSDALRAAADGWLYDTALQGVILKHTMSESAVNCAVRW